MKFARLFRVVIFLSAAVLSSCGSLRDNANRSLPGQPQESSFLVSQRALGAALLRSTAVASLNQPVTTVRTGLAVMWNRPRAFFTENNPFPLVFHPHPENPPGSVEFERELDRLGCLPANWGKVKWLVDGREFFPEFDRQLASAKKEIDVQMFIFDNDDIAVRYADRLKLLSLGKKVRVLFDDLGSAAAQGSAPETMGSPGFSPPADVKRYLKKDSQVRVRRILNPWLVCDHTKLIVIDRTAAALLGGMNIGREYFNEWHDLMVRVEGPVVADFSREFNRAWRRAGPLGDLGLFRKPARAVTRVARADNDIAIRLLRTDPGAGIHHIHEATVLAIRAAKRRIWVQNAYFSHAGITRELVAAARRGVDVRVIIPGKSDSAVMMDANRATAAILIRAGGKVYSYPGMTHMKVMICDDWAQAGSANLDTLSLRINRELNIALSDRTAVRALAKAVFLPDFRKSAPLGEEDVSSYSGIVSRFLAQQL